jgi:hypothetical protein
MKDEKEEAISEKFSEKKKRGRPRLLNPEDEKTLRQGKAYCDNRTIQNEHYASRASLILGIKLDNPPEFPFAWLGDNSKIKRGFSQRRGYRLSILAELGRIDDEMNLIEAATAICKRKPTAQEAIKMIRGWRLQRAAAGSLTLEETLRKAIQRYRGNNPDITNDEIYDTTSSLSMEYFERIMLGKQGE